MPVDLLAIIQVGKETQWLSFCGKPLFARLRLFRPSLNACDTFRLLPQTPVIAIIL